MRTQLTWNKECYFILNSLKPVVYLRVIFQEIDVFQCVNQEFSRSRKFSFLHNRSVYNDFI